MPGLLLVNARSGDPSPSPAELCREAERRGIRAHVLRRGEDVAELARAADADAVGIAGGDGSLAPVAAAARERDLPFVCVPFGTRNHFARDLGLDRDDPFAALAAFTDGAERRVDAAEVNGRLFLNNVSLGVYAGVVHRRERHRRRSAAFARLRALAALPRVRHPIRLSLDGAELVARLVLVANNGYGGDLLAADLRERLDEGVLHLYVAPGLTPADWEERVAPEFHVGADRPHVRAAIDGEPALLEAPLAFRSLPGALRVLVPQALRDDATGEA